MLKTYHGSVATKNYSAMVNVRTDRLKKLTHHVIFSPDGFSWGGDSLGSTELARCILLDAFGAEQCPSLPEPCLCEIGWVDEAYTAFNDEVISKLDGKQDWKLDQVFVVDWTLDYLDQKVPESVPA